MVIISRHFFINITFKSSYNWFKIDIHQQLRPLTANYLAMFKVTSTTIYTQDKVNYAVSEREDRVIDLTTLTRMMGCTGKS